MNLDLVITQLRRYCPDLGGRVAGAADYQKGLSTQVWMAAPAAYVIPLEEEAAPSPDLNGLQQIVTERIGIVVQYDSSADRRGQEAVSNLDEMRLAIFRAVLNWNPHPDRAARGLFYMGGQTLDLDRARLFYQLEFGQEVTITDLDGWQPPEAPLTEIDITATNASTGDTMVQSHVSLSQS